MYHFEGSEVVKYRCLYESSFQAGRMLLGGLVSSQILHHDMHKSCKWFCDLSKILEEFSIVAYNAKESSYLFGILQWSA